MAATFESGFVTTLAAKLAAGDTTMTVATVPTVTAGRLFLKSGSTKEWISFTGVSGSTITGLTRGLSKTADPSTVGTGLTWVAGTTVTLVEMHDQMADKQQDTTFPKAFAFSGTTNSGLRVNNLTTAQRDALVGANGMVVYNSTTGELNQYISGAWSAVAAGSTQANSSTTVAGKVETATSAESLAGTATGGTGANLFVLPLDISANAQSGIFTYAADAGANDTYAITLVPALTAYATGQTIRFKANTANTGACTINVNALGAKTIKRPDGNDTLTGDIIANRIYDIIYDGTNFVSIPYIDAIGSGDGADGALTVASGTTSLTIPSNGYLEKYYSTITISGGTLNFTTSATTGNMAVLYCAGDCTISGGTIDMIGKGASGGAGGGAAASGVSGTQGNGVNLSAKTNFGVRGATGGTEGTGGAALTNFGGYTRGYAGGGGGGGSGGAVQAGGAGGAGGGCIVLHVGGILTLSGGTFNCTGNAGTSATGGSGYGPSGGGGGGAGSVVVLYNEINGSVVSTFTLTGGAGGNGGDGAAGTGGSSSVGGGGAGSYAAGGGGSVSQGAGTAGSNSTWGTGGAAGTQGATITNAGGSGAGGGGAGFSFVQKIF